MSNADQFKRQPRRKVARGKSVAVSDETKAAYLKLANERAAKDERIERHLPPDMKR